MSETAKQGERLLWAEEVAELAGVETRTIHFYAAQTKRHRAAGKPTSGDMPLPVRRVPRKVPTKDGGVRTVVSPQWDRADIEAWLPTRLGPGGRLASDLRKPPGETPGSGGTPPERRAS